MKNWSKIEKRIKIWKTEVEEQINQPCFGILTKVGNMFIWYSQQVKGIQHKVLKCSKERKTSKGLARAFFKATSVNLLKKIPI